MKKLLLSLLFLAGSADAQEATLIVPVTRPAEAKNCIRSITIAQAQVIVAIDVRDAGTACTSNSDPIRYYNVVVPDPALATATATVAGFVTAINTVRATETGGVLRKLQFRVLGYLFDTGYLPGTAANP